MNEGRLYAQLKANNRDAHFLNKQLLLEKLSKQLPLIEDEAVFMERINEIINLLIGYYKDEEVHIRLIVLGNLIFFLEVRLLEDNALENLMALAETKACANSPSNGSQLLA